jgi:hypothetical protein
MSKFILLSLLIAMVAIPARAARDPRPHRGLKRALVQGVGYYAFYMFALMYLWGRF